MEPKPDLFSSTNADVAEELPSIRIGTSGYSYDDWHPAFYPSTLRPNRRLEYYATHFKTVEINHTFYRLPALSAVYGMLGKVGDGFTFFVKAHRDLTHVTRNAAETLPRFQEMLKAYQQEKKLAGVLLQFPANFEYTGKNEDYLRWVVESLNDVRTVVEFRHVRWIKDKTMDLLRELNAAYCIVDMPQVRGFPPSRVEATSAEIAYFRFHGQNREKWAEAATRDERYDYSYTDDELKEWAESIITLSYKVKQEYVYFNNHYQGAAAKNAHTLEGFLKSYVKGSGISRVR
jgi:uncharacterized protein YecE (DUF72 family)